MKILKLENCDDVVVNSTPFVKFAGTITKEMLNDDNDNNKVLCRISVGIKQERHPKVYFEDEKENKIHCLEFVSGKEEVLLKELSYEVESNNKQSYVMNLLQDKNRIWKTKILHYLEDKEIPNQILTLLRLCKVDKEEYKKNPDILSKKFTKVRHL